jgi:6-phosphogluconolactonase
MTSGIRTIDYGERGSVVVTADGDELANLAASLLQSTIAETVAAGRVALVALSGGSTPKKMGTLLATDPLKSQVAWDQVHIFWGDERFVPLADSESNAGEAMRGFLDDAPIPSDRVHAFQTEGVSPEASAEAMESTIHALGENGNIPAFDLILLGMGDDGHTASLFPGTSAVHEATRLVVANQVDKLDTTRLTFTLPLINAARKVAFLVGGAGKADMLHQVLDGPVDIDATPSQVVRPTDGHLTWIVDEAAAARLERSSDG